MKTMVLGLGVLILSVQALSGQEKPAAAEVSKRTEQEILQLSKDKWLWMADRKVDALDKLFHAEAIFVHMGATMKKSQELGVIQSGGIHYKQADIQEISVRVIGSTAIVLAKLRLVAVVGGNEVTNPFSVTEVYVQQEGGWKLAALAFTRLIGQ